MQLNKEPMKHDLADLRSEFFGEVFRQVIFSPTTGGNNFQKLAYIDVPPGAVGTAHVHLGEEVVFTIKGEAILTIEGIEHRLEAGTAFLIPPDVPHPARVVSEENWIAVAAYCDECPVLKAARDKEDVRYPLSVGGSGA
jgi:quercetin dioxygenase-like cupin family protein